MFLDKGGLEGTVKGEDGKPGGAKGLGPAKLCWQICTVICCFQGQILPFFTNEKVAILG